jgi:uncharacterized damage-inducible protein DinB
MYTIEHLRELFTFNDWANRKLIASLRKHSSTSALRYIVHVLITEKEYFERLRGKDSTGFNFWPEPDLGDCEGFAQENAVNYERLLKNIDDNGINSIANYKTSEGLPYENTFREMLTHVLFHSVTHRGQALSAMRRDGFEPPQIDYIVYLREAAR